MRICAHELFGRIRADAANNFGNASWTIARHSRPKFIAMSFGRGIWTSCERRSFRPGDAESMPAAAAGMVSRPARIASALTVKRITPSPLFDATHRVLLSLLQDVRIAKFCCWRLTRSERGRALNNRLEITGKKSLDLTQTRDAHGLKILLEEGASSVRVLRLQVYGFAADVPQRAMDRSVVVGTRSFAQSLTACPIRCECG